MRAGGPDGIVSDDCGLKVDVTDPQTLPKDLATAIRRLHDDPALRHVLGNGARAKLMAEQVWPALSSSSRDGKSSLNSFP